MTAPEDTMAPEAPETLPPSETCPGVRQGLFALGCFCLVLGAVGMVLPVMPTTIFLLIALWAFSRSSPRFHRWLYEHPRLGRGLRAWHAHRVIPVRAKILAVAMMAASLAYVGLYLAPGWAVTGGLAALLGAVSLYILTRPSRPPLSQTGAS